MKKQFLILALLTSTLALFSRQTEQQQEKKTSFPTAVAFKNTSITYKLIAAPNNTWGYDIYTENHLMIHQVNAPGLSGNEGFKTKSVAQKVAELVIYKMKKGEMPPTITEEEMKSLNVL